MTTYTADRPLVTLSLGAGVQSSTLALMAAHGLVDPMPDCAIFADTGWEPEAVYDHLAWLSYGRLPFPIYVVKQGDLRSDQIVSFVNGREGDNGERQVSLPYYVKANGQEREGAIRRQCTSEYKINPIEKKIRELLGLKHRQRWPKERAVVQYYGISLDEIQRCKIEMDPVAKWRINRYPLIEQRMTRHDCLQWMERQGFPKPPRSACIGCPFHSNAEWRDMRDNRPVEWADAVTFDAAIRKAGGMRGDTYLHRDCVPLDEVDLSTAEDAGQLSLLDECEGMCGV